MSDADLSDGSHGEQPAVVVHLAGDLDLTGRAGVTALLEGAAVLPLAQVVVDLSAVAFMDCAGLGVLLAARAALGGRLRVRAPSEPVARVLSLTGTADLFDVVPAPDGGAHGTGADRGPATTGPAVLDPRVVADLARTTVDRPHRLLLQEVVGLAARVLPGVDGLCLTSGRSGATLQAAFVGDLAASLDERPFGAGPCLHAALTGAAVDLALGESGTDDEVRWPADAWADVVAVARRRGVRAVLALPVLAGGRPVGALTLYSVTATVDPTAREAAGAFVDAAGGVLDNALLHAEAVRRASHLQEAMVSRAEIEQAKGVLMALHGIDADAAFDRLSRTSQATNTKLRVLAADVLARARRHADARAPAPAPRGVHAP